MKKLFSPSWKKLILLFCLEIAAIVLHNVVSVIFKTEEAVIFIIAIFIIPAFTLISLMVKITKSLLKPKNN